MDLEPALLTAIDYETRVCHVYDEAIAAVDDPHGKEIFTRLLREEQGHLRYLEARLAEWRRDGRVRLEVLATALPNRVSIEASGDRLKRRFAGRSVTTAVEHLRRALAVETETGAYYRGLLSQLAPEHRSLFAPFATIEEGHYDYVQMQLDALSGSAFWYGYDEVNVEVG